MGFNSGFKELRKGKDTGTGKRKQGIVLCGEVALEKAMDHVARQTEE